MTGAPKQLDQLTTTLDNLLEAIRADDRSDRMLCGVAAASQALLSNGDLDAALEWALELVVRAAGADRVTVFERHIDDHGDEVFVRRAFRNRDGVDDTRLREFGPLSPRALGASSWREALFRGESIRIQGNDATDEVGKTLNQLGIASLLMVPIRVDRATWGMVGFFDLDQQRPWTAGEQCVLATTAAAIAGAVWRKRDEDHKRLLRRRLMRSEKLRSLSLLAAGVADGMNDLLTVLRASGAGQDARTEAAATRAGKLVDQLRLFAVSDADLRLGPVHVHELVRSTIKLMRVRLPDAVELDLSAVADLAEISADATQLRQVVVNLVENASDAMSDGGTIAIAARAVALTEPMLRGADFAAVSAAPGDYVEIAVTDTGAGIADEVKAKVFDPLFSTKDDGAGLGLATVLGIVRAHRGAIIIESTATPGTCLRVMFPARH